MANKSVEIVTAHNIRIDYELASLTDRGIAFIIDAAIILVWYLLLFILFRDTSPDTFNLILYVLFVPVFFTYNLFCESFFGGQSIGKKSMGLKVVRMNGHNPTLGDCLLRWSMRMIDIGASFGVLGAILISATDKSQRIGDMAANTAVVRINPPNRYTINDILSIADNTKHKTTYLNVVQFSDEDMLLIKNSIERVKTHPNPDNKKLIHELVTKVSEKLNINDIPKDKVKFLRTILQDYIVLTR